MTNEKKNKYKYTLMKIIFVVGLLCANFKPLEVKASEDWLEESTTVEVQTYQNSISKDEKNFNVNITVYAQITKQNMTTIGGYNGIAYSITPIIDIKLTPIKNTKGIAELLVTVSYPVEQKLAGGGNNYDITTNGVQVAVNTPYGIEYNQTNYMPYRLNLDNVVDPTTGQQNNWIKPEDVEKSLKYVKITSVSINRIKTEYDMNSGSGSGSGGSAYDDTQLLEQLTTIANTLNQIEINTRPNQQTQETIEQIEEQAQETKSTVDNTVEKETELTTQANEGINNVPVTETTEALKNDTRMINGFRFIRDVFDRTTNNTPIGVYIGGLLLLGLAAYLIGRRAG